jgi:flavin-dependent thymidylate synthase
MTGEVAKYADSAMYKAEVMQKDASGDIKPRVYLLSMTPDPLGVIAAGSMMYEGKVVRSLTGVTDVHRRHYYQQIMKTHLKAPFELVDFHFMIEGVTRSFTHQMVRQRTAVFMQESLRFAVKEDAASAVALPPSLESTEGKTAREMTLHPEVVNICRDIWDESIVSTDAAYQKLINMGMPAEDARGLLPHAITTRLHYKTNLRNLLEHAGNRLCTQAQMEWRLVWMQIVQAISKYRSGLYAQEWQQDELSKIFKPICYLTGKCEFMAEFDRYCSIRERVENHHHAGVLSQDWSDIKPQEWMLDPAAARQPG